MVGDGQGVKDVDVEIAAHPHPVALQVQNPNSQTWNQLIVGESKSKSDSLLSPVSSPFAEAYLDLLQR
ncbi:hypothetical protein L6452_05741 [Arctium lappa]|uniref:Uncharacterized protein n=1 Tax=Arctium lappa TaxID=4217 RepID=A0ACB9EHY1_ARCLA|nr:hypothetical protein L6452_05741 [Arctium lappa]